MDESYSDKVFCLAGVIIKGKELNNITSEINKFKQGFGLTELDYIKFSLGSSGEDKKIKEKIKDSINDKKNWLTYFRIEAIKKISSFNLTAITSLHQDVRRTLIIPKPIPVDFYLTAFKFLVQRIWWKTKDKISPLKIFVVLDNPPEKNSMTKICRLYKEAFYEGFSFYRSDSNIPPLNECGFFESPFISKSDYNRFIQISDFCAGAVKERGKDLLKNNSEKASRNILKILVPKIYGYNEGNIIGRGLVVFPKDSKLYGLITKDVENIITENKKNKVPF